MLRAREAMMKGNALRRLVDKHDFDVYDPAELRRQAAIARLGGPIAKWSAFAKEAPKAWFRSFGLDLLIRNITTDNWVDDFIATDSRYTEYRRHLFAVLGSEKERAKRRFRAIWADFLMLSPRFVALVDRLARGTLRPEDQEEARTLMNRLGHDEIGTFFEQHAAASLKGLSEEALALAHGPLLLHIGEPGPVQAARNHTNTILIDPKEP